MEIQEINDPKNNIEWDELQYDIWEIFREPHDLTKCEELLAMTFLDTMKIDIDGEYLITFRGAPKHFANLFVHLLRQVKNEYPTLFSEKTCKEIINES